MVMINLQNAHTPSLTRSYKTPMRNPVYEGLVCSVIIARAPLAIVREEAVRATKLYLNWLTPALLPPFCVKETGWLIGYICDHKV
jgi:hypothetical protein